MKYLCCRCNKKISAGEDLYMLEDLWFCSYMCRGKFSNSDRETKDQHRSLIMRALSSFFIGATIDENDPELSDSGEEEPSAGTVHSQTVKRVGESPGLKAAIFSQVAKVLRTAVGQLESYQVGRGLVRTCSSSLDIASQYPLFSRYSAYFPSFHDLSSPQLSSVGSLVDPASD